MNDNNSVSIVGSTCLRHRHGLHRPLRRTMPFQLSRARTVAGHLGPPGIGPLGPVARTLLLRPWPLLHNYYHCYILPM